MDTAGTAFDAPPLEPAERRFSDHPAVRTLGVLAPWIIVIVSGVTRFVRLASPHAIIPLDETYYARDAAAYLRHGVEEGFAVHPPVGKWMIAFGEWVFGNNSFGWRFSAAVAGTLSILLIWLIAKRLWGTTFAAVSASIFLAADGLFFVQSRIAMLDIFLAFWILVSFWLLLEDRARAGPEHRGIRWWRLGSAIALGLALATKWSAAALIPMMIVIALVWEFQRLLPTTVWRARILAALFGPSLLLVGLFVVHDAVFRAGITLGLLGVVAGWLVTEIRAADEEPNATDDSEEPREPSESEEPNEPEALPEHSTSLTPSPEFPTASPPHPALRSAAIVASFALIPLLVYLASYLPWFFSTKRYVPPLCHNNVTAVGGLRTAVPKAGMSLWFCYQREIYTYHKNLKATNADGTPIHPYLSHAWSWPWIGRPAAHYFHSEKRDRNSKTCRDVNGTPLCSTTVTPVLYDAEIIGIPNPISWWPAFFVAIPLLAFWAYRRDPTAALLLAMFAPLYLPWLVTTRPLFMFYMTPAVPFLVLALVHVLHRLSTAAPQLTPLLAAWPALAVLGFVFFYPVLAAYPVTDSVWHSRMIFGGGTAFSFPGDCFSKFMKLHCWI